MTRYATWMAVGLAALAAAIVLLRPDGPRPAVDHEPAPAVTPTDAAPPGAPRVDPSAPLPKVPAPAEASPRADARTAPPAAAGMIVAVDPETGELGMPTARQVAELAGTADADEALSRSSEGLVEEHHPGGWVTVDLQGRFREYVGVFLDADGRPVFVCRHDLRASSPAALDSLHRRLAVEEE